MDRFGQSPHIFKLASRTLQSIEHRPLTSPKVLLYPTRKLRGLRVFGEAKKCVHQYKPPEVGIAEPRSAFR